MNSLIAEALGQASMCWDPRPSNQVFDSTATLRIHDELEHKLPKYLELRDNSTFVPVLATPILWNEMTHKCGYRPGYTRIVLVKLQTSEVQVEPHKWQSPWMAKVHLHIELNWKDIKSQSMINFSNEPLTPEVTW